MRIGLLIYGSLDILTGGFLYDRLLVEYLRRQGDQVEIISLPWRTYGRHLSDNFSLSLYRRLCKAPLDVLIQDELNHPSVFWLNRWLKRRVRYPIVTIVHLLRSSEARPDWQNSLYRWVERQYLLTLDGLVFNSHATRKAVEELAEGLAEGLAEELGGPRHPGVVAYPGCDHLSSTLSREEITARTQQAGPLKILFIGNLIPRKGLHVLIEALAYLPLDDWRLTVIGSLTMDPGYVYTVRRRLEQAGLNVNITLLGALPNAEVALHLAQNQLLAVPSLYEPFGIVYVEALGFGQPAIATTVGAASEIITHGREGFLLSPGDATTLAQHIRELHQDRERLLQMSLAARERYSTYPTWDQSSECIRQFLQTLVNR